MEDTLWAQGVLAWTRSAASLNPCFNGRYSLSGCIVKNKINRFVLILVLMEDTLWAL